MTDGSLLARIHALDLHLQAALDAALVGTGTTSAQWRVLDAALNVPGSSSAELARACQVTPQTMHQLVSHLADAGLLVRKPHPVHGRIQQLYCSNAGELRHAEGALAAAGVEDRLLMALGEEDCVAFARFVSLALGALRRS
jgi:DNA-binding MarR family transcriptional regulator